MKSIHNLKKKLLNLSNSVENRDLADTSVGKQGLRNIRSKIKKLEAFDLEQNLNVIINKDLTVFENKDLSEKIAHLINLEKHIISLDEDYKKNELYKKMRDLTETDYVKKYSKPAKNMLIKSIKPLFLTYLYFNSSSYIEFFTSSFGGQSKILEHPTMISIISLGFSLLAILEWINFAQNFDIDPSPKLDIPFEKYLDNIRKDSQKLIEN